VLAVGAHPGDIELGCGGALLAHRDRGDEIHLVVMTGEGSVRDDPLHVVAEQVMAAAVLGAVLHWGGFEDGAVPSGRGAIAAIESVLVASRCDTVYGHALDDTHQDHRATAQATFSAARRAQQVLAYESTTSLHFDPTVFVDLGGRVGSKLELLATHRSQVTSGRLVDLSGVAAQARYRGTQARVSHAEGFESHRFVWQFAQAPGPAPDIDQRAPFGARALLTREPGGWEDPQRSVVEQ
jgi:LmbE family N-acetylglucosaminyl deacetylase